MSNPTLVYSIPEACSLAHTGRTALYQAINSGALPARKRGKRTLILHEDLYRWLQSLPSFAVKAALTPQSPATGGPKSTPRKGATI
jgi:excisionase family DNA binding protein